ncbi:hypothetical protein BsWGS_21146 [Bradybaena similaris]
MCTVALIICSMCSLSVTDNSALIAIIYKGDVDEDKNCDQCVFIKSCVTHTNIGMGTGGRHTGQCVTPVCLTQLCTTKCFNCPTETKTNKQQLLICHHEMNIQNTCISSVHPAEPRPHIIPQRKPHTTPHNPTEAARCCSPLCESAVTV